MIPIISYFNDTKLNDEGLAEKYADWINKKRRQSPLGNDSIHRPFQARWPIGILAYTTAHESFIRFLSDENGYRTLNGVLHTNFDVITAPPNDVESNLLTARTMAQLFAATGKTGGHLSPSLIICDVECNAAMRDSRHEYKIKIDSASPYVFDLAPQGSKLSYDYTAKLFGELARGTVVVRRDGHRIEYTSSGQIAQIAQIYLLKRKAIRIPTAVLKSILEVAIAIAG